MSALLQVEALSKTFGAVAAVNNLSFQIEPGEVVGIIGPNGAGKTTAVNLISGVLRPSKGRVCFGGEDVTGLRPDRLVRRGLVRTFQATTVYSTRIVRENVRRGSFRTRYPGFLHALLETPKQRAWRAESEKHVDRILSWFGLSGHQDTQAAALPYGFQKTLGMAIALAAEPKLILLDEPAAGLSAEEADHVRDTIVRIRESGVTVVVIDHNMRFISNLCDRIVVMHHGEELAAGTPREVLTDPRVIEAYLGKRHVVAQVG
jgi:branched-chain amino acid transport system ATP-binding protein